MGAKRGGGVLGPPTYIVKKGPAISRDQHDNALMLGKGTSDERF